MGQNKKGQLSSNKEYAKHLRKYLKRRFWKGERQAEKTIILDSNQKQIDPES
jgi:hypothetical protein